MLTRPESCDEIDRELAARSLREFVRQAWPIVEPSTPFVPGWHIDAIIEHLEAVTRRPDPESADQRSAAAHEEPAGFGLLAGMGVDSLAGTPLAVQQLRRASLSIRDSVKCRRLIESPWYQQRWADRFALTSDQNTKGRFDNNRSGYRLSTSVGGAVTGEGGDRIVCDDPHNVQEAESDSVRKSDARLVRRGDVHARERSQDRAKVVVMQRCHQQDLSGHLLEQGGWEHLCLPAEYEGPTCVTSIGLARSRAREHGELLWPERFGPEEIEISEAQPRQLRRGRPASAASLARRWGHYSNGTGSGTGSRGERTSRP